MVPRQIINGGFMNIDKDRLLSVEQVRKLLHCSQRHVYDLVAFGELTALRLGRKHGIRIRESAVNEFIKRKEAEDV